MLKEVKIELTNRCARNCKHCSSSATNSSNNVKELGFEDVKKIIYEAKNMNIETIVFTGGEPLMYERLPELVKLTSKLGLKSTIYTFAYKTDETLNKYRQLIDFGLNKIVYSLAESLSDEEDASVYDKAEFFDKVFENNSARLGFHYTVSKDSFSRLKQVVNETIDTFKTRSYFDKVSLLRFVPHGKGTIDMDLSKEDGMWISPKFKLLLIKEFERLIAILFNFSNLSDCFSPSFIKTEFKFSKFAKHINSFIVA